LDIKHALLGANENTQIFGFADFDLENFQVLQRDKFANPTVQKLRTSFFLRFSFTATFFNFFFCQVRFLIQHFQRDIFPTSTGLSGKISFAKVGPKNPQVQIQTSKS
jgi:hypothetical protein